MNKLQHLSPVDHEYAAMLLNRVQDDLTELTKIVKRAPFTDRAMRCKKGIQERLIDPLREAADNPDLYQSVYYALGRAR